MIPASDAPTARGGLPRLFCLMGEELYGTLAQHLADEITLIGMYDVRELALIARARRDGPGAGGYSIADVSPFYFERIRAEQPAGPYLLGGFSAGGAVALDVAHRLRALGEDVALVVLFDTVAYRHLRTKSPLRRAAGSLRLALDDGWSGFGRAARRAVSRATARLAPRRAPKAPAAPPRPSRKELQELRLQFFQAALLDWEPGRYEGAVLLFTALDAERNHHYVIEPHLGWQDVVDGELCVHSFPGDHLAILQEPNAPVVARRIVDCANRAMQAIAARQSHAG